MIRVTKEFRFEMAHALYGYNGPCKNIHGHSYRLSVCVTGQVLNNSSEAKNGMVMDFTDLKKIVQSLVIDELDHALLLNGNSPHKEMALNKEVFEKVIFVNYQPTCENLVIEIAERLKKALPGNLELHHLKLHETVNSYAEWYSEDN
ncbi:MAG: 6-carboxytetrahydropterin synthase QueD [Bacteroidia bacterium]|jgi:6-pyruvoyltetrahydropterin/6-carboxytetrahydropterin synthase|nr:6-carboxytetrahydropterin synthase QueD [Sphingobacteriaceae bacterium]MBP9068078.1 6-carboxytetrahydropterin synthase QueD [Bacteroidia bacterium]